MKFSLNLLSNFIDLKDFFYKLNELEEKLSSAGFEVEEWTKKQLPHLVVVEIKEKKKHPSADRLSLCQVESQKGKHHSIVCGATNFQEEDKAVLALPGAVLPGAFEIKTRKIRGETSEGMLVSMNELGLTSAEEKDPGILILPKSVPIGTNFAAHFGLNDVIFDIDITPNRADCLSHFGLARELSCILDRPLCFKGSDARSPNRISKEPQKNLEVEVKQKNLCVRYTGRAVYEVNVQPSPLWLKVALENLGFKSINNIVDVTNYCLIQWGQPLHAFDLDYLKEKIIVDFSQKGEKLKTLDNQEIQLTGKELCIRDTKGSVALAGVIGGRDSGIHSKTKNIFIESACFDPSQVRRTSKRFNIETDSSYRFSRGVPSENTLDILHKAETLIQELAGGVLAQSKYDIWEKPAQPKFIKITKEDIKRRLGVEPSFKKFQNWMKRLHCEVKNYKKEEMEVRPPFFRFDINIKEDLIEEYARLEGYDKIPETIAYLSDFPKKDQKEYTVLLDIANILAHEGFYQAINHSFISQKFSHSFFGIEENSSSAWRESAKLLKEKIPAFLWSNLLENDKNISPIFVQNPLSAEYDMMRMSLAPSLFKNAQQSIRHGCLHGRLFELGNIFYLSNIAATEGSLSPSHSHQKSSYKESGRLGFITWGQEDSLWKKNTGRPGVYDLKTALQVLIESFGLFDYEWVSGSTAPHFVHPYQYIILKIGGEKVAYIGSLSPIYAEKYKIRTDMALAEMDTQILFDKSYSKQPFQNLSPFPVVGRDLSFLVPKDFPANYLSEGIKKITGPVCRAVQIFDVYEDDRTNKEKARSVSFRLILQSDKQTLTEEYLKNLQSKLTKELVSQYPVKLR